MAHVRSGSKIGLSLSKATILQRKYLFGFGPIEKNQIITIPPLTTVYENQLQGGFIETVVTHGMVGQIVSITNPTQDQNNLEQWIYVTILHEDSSRPLLLQKSVWIPVFKQDSKLYFLKFKDTHKNTLMISLNEALSNLESLNDKLNILKNRMNHIRGWIFEGLTEEDQEVLRKSIAEEDYAEVGLIKEKVLNQIALLPQSERDFVALLLVTFGEARGGNSRAIEDMASNTAVRAEMLVL